MDNGGAGAIARIVVEAWMHKRFISFTNRYVGPRERLFHPERSGNWDYIWTILNAFGLFVAIVTAGMLAWIVGIF